MKKAQHTMISGKAKGYLFMAVFVALAAFNASAQTVTPATNGSAISADNVATSTYVTLTGPVYSEAANGNIGTGTIILNAPSGFTFDLGGTAPTVLVARIGGGGAGSRDLNSSGGTGVGTHTITSRTTTQITFTITKVTTSGVTNRITWQNVRVIPTAGTPLASGNITKTGTSTMAAVTNGTTNFGTLTEVGGAVASFSFSTISSPQCSNNISATITAKDQYNNTATYTGTAAMTTTAGTVTPATSNVFSAGTLTQTFSVSGSGASQTLTATNTSPTATGTSNTFTINAIPAITVQPTAPAAVCSGTGTQTISVTATGAGLSYSWRKGGVAVSNGGVISGQGTATLTLTSPTTSDAGSYDVVISGTCTPSVTSNAVTVTVNTAPAITVQPTSPFPTCSGSGSQVMSVTATGAGLTYSWRLGGTPVTNGGVISGQGTATLTLTSPLVANAGSYDVVISGTCSPSVTSNAVTVTVNSLPNISVQPTPPTAVCAGTGSQTLSVTASGTGISYSWRKGGIAVSNGAVISGQGTNTLTLTAPAASDAGNYDVVVSGTCSPAATSSAVSVVVNSAPAISVQPTAPAATCSGSGTQNISVTATGAGLSYSWRLGGTPVVNGGVISGQGTATLTLTSPTTSDAGSYDVVISGTCPPSVTSSAVTVTINTAPAITVQPTTPATTCSGSGTQTMSVTATGAGLSYSWRRNGTALVNGGVISGQGTATLTLTSPVVANAGSYDVVVSGTCSPSVTSSAVTVTVNALPAITVQPTAPAAVCSGTGTQTMSVTATGTGLSYSWRKGGVAVTNGAVISGQGTATLTLTSPTTSDAGSYDVIVSGTCTPAVTSSAVTVTVNTAPNITVQPSTPSATCSGSGTQTMSVTATGAGLSYSWRRNGTAVTNGGVISGQGTATLTLTSPTTGNAGNYDVVISGTCTPSVTSSAVTVTINTAPAITVQPTAPAAVCSGTGTQTMSVTATGTGLSYSWRRGGVAVTNGGVISGQGTATLTLTNPLVANAGSYDVVVSGTCTPAVTSSAVTVTVNSAPSISVHPADQTLCVGNTLSVSVTATGTALTYQWRKNGTNIGGANSSTYTKSAVLADAADYDVVVSGTCSPSATSNVATVEVNTTPTITTQPADQVTCAGTPVSFNVAVTAGSGTGITYQWRKNTTNIVGATSATYTIASPVVGDIATNYNVRVTSCGTTITSANAALEVNTTPTITVQPTNRTVCAGTSTTFNVTATAGSGTDLSYQWRKGGVDISGATSSSYTISSPVTGDAGNYDVEVTSCGTTVTSNAASLTINTAPDITVQPTTPTATCSGSGTQVLSVTATGTSLTYSWRRNGTAVTNGGVVSGQGTATLTLTSPTAANAGSYDVVVSGTCTPSETSTAVTVTVNALPAITVQPTTPTAVCSGTGTRTISVTATGTGLSYSWRRNGTAVTNGGVFSGQGTNTLTFTAPTTAEAGSYDVVVSGTCTPAVTSSAVTLTINTAPDITVQPTTPSATCSGSGSQVMSVTATGTGLTYSWRRNGTAVTNGGVVSGQGTATLTLTSPTAANAGSYDVVVSGTCTPSETSSAVTVTVNALPAITVQPTAPAAVCSGAGTQTMSVTATGTGLTYSWRRNGTAVTDDAVISGQGTNTLTLTAPTTSNAGSYTVVVSGTCTPAVTSSAVAVTVNTAPDITVQPSTPAATCSGSGSQVLSVTATGTGLTYSWRRNGTAVTNGGGTSGQGTATLTLTSPTAAHAGSYDVVVSGTCTPSETSSAVTVTVNALPAITVQPTTPAAVCSGAGTRTISVTATGTGLSYSWRRNGTAVTNGGVISGQGTNTLTLTNPVAANAGSYTVVVSGTCTPSVTSSAVTLTVDVAPVITTQPVAVSTCLGQGINLSVTATGTSLTYQWRKNGSNIVGATASTYSIANTVTTDAANYDVLVGNTGCGPVTSNSVAVTLTSPSSPPWSENFESITTANEYPNCMSSTNLGSNTFTRTYGGAGGTLGAHSGTDFGSWGDNADDWFFTGAILVPAGITYEFSYWYWTDNSSSFTSMDAGVGTSPTVAAMTTTVGTPLVGAAVGPINTWKKYSGTFTAPTTGVYYFGIHTTTNPGNAPDKIVIDDAGFMEVCSGAPTAGTAHISATCLDPGQTTNLSLTGYTDDYAGITFQWQSSPRGANSWTNISGATDTLYTATVNVHTDFRCVVRCIYSNQTSNSTVVTASIKPTKFNVSGGACAPVNIGVNGSQVGVSYQIILNGNVHITPPQMGTGGPINFGNQVDSGIYAVQATEVVSGCTQMMTGVATVSYCTSTWLGVTDSLWTTQTNWDPAAVPNNCYVNVIINSGTPFNPEITGTNIYVRNMTMNNGAKLNLRSQNLFVCGNWVGGNASHAMVVGNGTVHLVGQNGFQNIVGATKFDTLQINNNGLGVQMVGAAEVSINGGLHLQHNEFSIGSGKLTLLSKASNHHAYIDDFTFGFDGTITGNIEAQRYMPTPGRNQHFISSPVAGASLSQIGASGPDNTYTVPLPTCDETQATPNSPYGSTFVYNDGHRGPGQCMMGNWMIKSLGNMEVGRGYSSYQTGNTTRTVTGTANTGNISISGLNNSGYPTVNTLQGQPIESGWNLVGNPYPSAIDLTIDRTSEGFQNQIQVWQTTGPYSGTWQPLMITGVPGTVVIPPFQAFMVRVMPGSLGNHTFNFYQEERIRDNSTRFYRTQAENSLKLELTYANGGKDETKVEFNPEGTISFDDVYDANKPGSAPGKPTLYTHMNTNLWYGINTLSSLTQTTTVPMGLRADMNGSMTISAKGIQSFDPTTYIFLEDKKTGAWHNLRSGDYTFTAAKTDNQDRFVLHFTPPAKIMTSDATCSGSGMIQIEQSGSANWNYSLADENSVVISTGTLNAGSSVTLSANAGTYLLTLSDNNGYIVMKNIQVTGTQPIVASFTSDLNVAVPNENIIFTSTTDNAATYQWDFGDGAIGSGAATTHSYFSEGVYNVQLLVMNGGGCSSTMNQSVTITSRAATGLNSIVANKIDIWSSEDYVYVDFTKETKVEAEIDMYNVMGQLISREQFNRQAVYSKQITNMAAAYVIVKVINDDQTTTKKVFIAK